MASSIVNLCRFHYTTHKLHVVENTIVKRDISEPDYAYCNLYDSSNI